VVSSFKLQFPAYSETSTVILGCPSIKQLFIDPARKYAHSVSHPFAFLGMKGRESITIYGPDQ
jgi:hypothetical protein